MRKIQSGGMPHVSLAGHAATVVLPNLLPGGLSSITRAYGPLWQKFRAFGSPYIDWTGPIGLDLTASIYHAGWISSFFSRFLNFR
jgi:hypothetical protein